ncbi:MAG: hypothetical protein QM597_07015 [Aeromicrobium sp.]|uniref:helix-turn-helix domain-containing protein n=1 Tax=Aeromicrobium sp. TaxID=1871063 RepID=UPI0039E420F3
MSTSQKTRDTDLLDRIEADADEPTGPAIDAAPLRAIAEAMHARDTAEEDIRSGVEKAREAGLSWAVIGAALGVSRQAALKRYGH